MSKMCMCNEHGDGVVVLYSESFGAGECPICWTERMHSREDESDSSNEEGGIE